VSDLTDAEVREAYEDLRIERNQLVDERNALVIELDRERHEFQGFAITGNGCGLQLSKYHWCGLPADTLVHRTARVVLGLDQP